jgi:hypothetical protein
MSNKNYLHHQPHRITKQWLDTDYSLRVRFQTILLPEGAPFGATTMHFRTEKISPLYRYAPNKKDLSVKEKSLVVIPRRRQHYASLHERTPPKF